MTDLEIKMVLDSYGLLYILEVSDIEEEYVLKLLIEEGLIDGRTLNSGEESYQG